MKNTSYLNNPFHFIGLSFSFASLTVCPTAIPAMPSRADDIENTLGKIVATEIERSYGVVKDPLLTAYVNNIGQKLASVSGRTNVKYTFKVLNSDDVNATAAPGGYIFVNRGTIRLAKSEDELATVIGHEVGHVAGRHAMKQLNAQLLATLALAGFKSMKANTLGAVGSVAGGLALLKYSRDEENDADRRGLANAIHSGYEGRSMVKFFEAMLQDEKVEPSKFETYFLTHPTLSERIKRISQEPLYMETCESLLDRANREMSVSHFKSARELFIRAQTMSPNRADLSDKIKLCSELSPRIEPMTSMSSIDRERASRDIDDLKGRINSCLIRSAELQARYTRERKDTESEFENSAQSLTNVSRLVAEHDAFRYRQFARLAREFDRAAEVNANLRSIQDLSRGILSDLNALGSELKVAVTENDASSQAVLRTLLPMSTKLERLITSSQESMKSEFSDLRSGLSSIHFASDNLANSFRSPRGYSNSQYDILEMQVTSSQDIVGRSASSAKDQLSNLYRADYELALLRIDFVTRHVARKDNAVTGLIAHYLTQPIEQIKNSKPDEPFASAIDDTCYKISSGQIKVDRPDEKSKTEKADKRYQRDYNSASLIVKLILNSLQSELY